MTFVFDEQPTGTVLIYANKNLKNSKWCLAGFIVIVMSNIADAYYLCWTQPHLRTCSAA